MTTSCMYHVDDVLCPCVPVLVPRVTAGSPLVTTGSGCQDLVTRSPQLLLP